MTTENVNQNKTLATVLHLSVFTKYFIPLGNFIFPMLLWLSRKQDPFVDHHGRNALNFQISTFLYTIFIVAVGAVTFVYFGMKFTIGEPLFFEQDSFVIDNFSDALPFIITIGILGLLLLGLFVLELFAVINASIKANEGQSYNYPLTINFLSSEKPDESNHQNQSKNEQFNDTQKQTL
ncbi:DUF4870 domain-containing protein [Christiangramia forsetii]|uniref:DUF4870 domain-containing protein n=2 Tax=Christiangramia forsetii TaxID=411153 RepID=A0M022_CHRFK|nr:DUF4870 domain-containing protein [Christiangramia forsetii]GGG45913.1 hypothetical protein GCM10011532_32320 [Christiangramia forsetii]CAL65967.1 conserved hypothetical protein, membrane [Christiangramia forsetii KT0803]